MYELRASALGSCTKSQAALLQGFDPLPVPEKMQEIFDRGHAHEERNAIALLADWEIDNQQQEIELPLGPCLLTGHLDGKIRERGTDTYRVWESKSPGAWRKFYDAHQRGDWTDNLVHRYAWQISIYMLATGLEAMVTCLDTDDDKPLAFYIEEPPFTLQQVVERVIEICDMADGDLPIACSQRDYPCPVAYLHEEPEHEEDELLDLIVGDIEFARRMQKEWKAKEEAAKQKAVARLGDRDKVETGASIVTRYTQASPSKWDDGRLRDAMKAVGLVPDLYRIEGAVSERYKITKKGESSAATE